MKRFQRILKTGATLGALMATLPAAATTITKNVPTNTTTVDSDLLTDRSSSTNLQITGGGTLDLTNTGNSYSGGTSVNGAIVGVGQDSELGSDSGTLTLGSGANTGTLDLSPSTGTSQITSSRSINLAGNGGIINTSPTTPWLFSGVVSGGNLTVQGGGVAQFSNTSNSYSGNTVIQGNSTLRVDSDTELGSAGGILTLGTSAGAGTLDLTPSTTTTSSGRSITLDGSGTILASPLADEWNIAGVISGAGSLTVSSSGATPGTLILSGVNTYTGGTTISNGTTLSINSENNLGATSLNVPTGNVTLESGGILSFSNTTAVKSARQIDLGVGGGMLNTASSGSWTLTKGVVDNGNAAPLTITGTAAIVLDGQNTYTGGTNVGTNAGGTVTPGILELGDAVSPNASLLGNVGVTSGSVFSGQGTIAGSVTSDGTVNPGANGTGKMTVDGNFTQNSDGTLEISLTQSGAAQLNVAQTATLNGALTLNPIGLLHPGTYTLVTAGSIADGSLVDPARLSIGFAQTVTTTGTNTLQLTLTQLTSIPENPSIYPALANTALDDAQRTTDAVLSHLTNARSAGILDEMVVATSADHPTDDCSGCSPFGTWFQPVGGVSSTDGGSAAPGYNSNDYGFLAGIDTPVGDDGDDAKYVAGVAVGYSHGSVDESGGAHGTVSTPRVMLYGSWWTGPYAVDATIGGGYSSFTGTRPIALVGTAGSSYHGVQLATSVQGSRVFTIDSFVLTPAAGVEFARQSENSFTEAGASAYNLVGQRGDANSLRPYVAATLAKRFDVGLVTRIEPQVRMAYAYETMNSPGVSVDPTADDYTFRYPGITPSRGRASINAGVTVETSHNLNIYTDAGVVEAGNSCGEQFDAGVRYRF